MERIQCQEALEEASSRCVLRVKTLVFYLPVRRRGRTLQRGAVGTKICSRTSTGGSCGDGGVVVAAVVVYGVVVVDRG